MHLIKITFEADDDTLHDVYVNPEHIVDVVPSETEGYCCVCLSSGSEYLIPSSAEKCAEHIKAEASGGDAYK